MSNVEMPLYQCHKQVRALKIKDIVVHVNVRNYDHTGKPLSASTPVGITRFSELKESERRNFTNPSDGWLLHVGMRNKVRSGHANTLDSYAVIEFENPAFEPLKLTYYQMMVFTGNIGDYMMDKGNREVYPCMRAEEFETTYRLVEDRTAGLDVDGDYTVLALDDSFQNIALTLDSTRCPYLCLTREEVREHNIKHGDIVTVRNGQFAKVTKPQKAEN